MNDYLHEHDPHLLMITSAEMCVIAEETEPCPPRCSEAAERSRSTRIYSLSLSARFVPHTADSSSECTDEEMAAESTRRFTKSLLKPGSAAEIRQTASNAVRNATVTVRQGQRALGLILMLYRGLSNDVCV